MCNLKLLAISGSLRAESYNSAAIEALKELAPENIEMQIGNIGVFPLFNPDIEHAAGRAVEVLKYQLSQSDGLILASPEYAHGISGPMKNTLDWLVSGSEFPGIRVMIINTSPRAIHAENALREVIVTMSGVIVESAYVSIPLHGSNLDKYGIVQNQDISGALMRGLSNLSASIRQTVT